MGKLLFVSEDSEADVPDGKSIIEACKQNGVNFACQDGICGSCVINVTKGEENLSPTTIEEEDFFGNPTRDVRLACQCALMKGEAHIKN